MLQQAYIEQLGQIGGGSYSVLHLVSFQDPKKPVFQVLKLEKPNENLVKTGFQRRSEILVICSRPFPTFCSFCLAFRHLSPLPFPIFGGPFHFYQLRDPFPLSPCSMYGCLYIDYGTSGYNMQADLKLVGLGVVLQTKKEFFPKC